MGWVCDCVSVAEKSFQKSIREVKLNLLEGSLKAELNAVNAELSGMRAESEAKHQAVRRLCFLSKPLIRR